MTVQPSSAGSAELIERMETFADHGCSPNDMQMAQELVADALLVVRSRAIAQCSPQPVCDLCDAPLMCAACGHEQRPAHAQGAGDCGAPTAWMNSGHIEAYQSGNRDGIAWASPVESDFYDVALYAAPEPAPKTIMEAAASAADKISLWSNSKQGYANRIVPQPTQGGDKGESVETRRHYLQSIRDRLDQLYALVDDPRTRGHLSDEVDWIEAEMERAAPQPASNAGGEYTNEEIAARMQQTFNATGDKWFKVAADRLRGVACSSQQSRLADRLTDVIAMLDTPDAYNRGYIAAVCRSILSSVSSTQNSPPVELAPQNSAERMPKGDPASAGGETVPTPRGGEA